MKKTKVFSLSLSLSTLHTQLRKLCVCPNHLFCVPLKISKAKYFKLRVFLETRFKNVNINSHFSFTLSKKISYKNSIFHVEGKTNQNSEQKIDETKHLHS